MKKILLGVSLGFTAAMAAAKPDSLPAQAMQGFTNIPYGKLPVEAVLVISDLIPHGEPQVEGQTVFGTSGNDVIDTTGDEYDELTVIDALEGDDVIRLNRNQNAATNPGSDTIIGEISSEWDAPGYAAWSSPATVVVNLEAGTADDGFGDTDRLMNIRVVHLNSGTVIGTSANETVFSFDGGDKSLHMGGGHDTVVYWQQPSDYYEIEVSGTTVYVTAGNGSVDTITGAEALSFSDLSYEIIYPGE